MTDHTEDTTIRRYTAEDAHELMRLAGRDSAYADPSDDYLVAERGRHILVAVRLRDGLTIADPFTHTAALAQLVGEEAARIAHQGKRSMKAVPIGLGAPQARLVHS